MSHLIPEKLSFIRGLLARLPLLFWCLLAVVIYAMLMELPPKQGGWPYWDKVQHLLVFVVLSSVAFTAYPKQRRLSAILLILFGAITEWLQATLTVTRMASLGDWLADASGVILALILFRWLASIIAKRVELDAD